MSYAQVGEFMAALRRQPSVIARALEFLVLTAARTGEVVGATWSEIDLGAKTWTIPAARTKRIENIAFHYPSLHSSSSRQCESLGHSDYVFPGVKEGRPIHESPCCGCWDAWIAKR